MNDAMESREQRARSEHRRRTILELAALDKSDFEEVITHILGRDAEELGIARVNCWAFEPDPPAVRCVCGVVRGQPGVECGAVVMESECPTYFQALAKDPIILADDARTDPRTGELRDGYLVPRGITSMMDVPVWVRGALWGVICHEHVGPPRHWTDSDRDFAISIGHIVSMAVEARGRAEAERAAQSSEYFVGTISHDLRNPLNAVRMSAEYILACVGDGGAADKGVPRAARRIVTSVDRMGRMVEQLLDFTRIRLGGGLPVEPETVDLGDIARRVVGDALAVHPGLAIDTRIVGDTVGRWDGDRLWQLLSNLVGNAVAYGEDVRLVVKGDRPDMVTLQVCNRGAIPSELLPEIFEPFRRRKGPSTGSGLGLGLFIAREIVTAHGGSISVDSHDDETVFTIRLPRFGVEARAPSHHSSDTST